MKEQIKDPEIIQLSSEQIASLSDAQFKTLVIKKLTELVVKMKAMLRETKENVQGTNSEAKETGTQTMVWTKRKKETSNQKRMKKQEFKKMRTGLGTSGTTLKVPTSNHRSAGRRGEARN